MAKKYPAQFADLNMPKSKSPKDFQTEEHRISLPTKLLAKAGKNGTTMYSQAIAAR